MAHGAVATVRGVRIGIRCDVGPQRGVGHVMRSLALAEELRGRGAEVVFVCDSHTVPWANDQILARGLPVEPAVWTAAEHLKLFDRLDVEAVVFDSYDLSPEPYGAVRGAGLPTLAIVDGELRGAEADRTMSTRTSAPSSITRSCRPGGPAGRAGLRADARRGARAPAGGGAGAAPAGSGPRCSRSSAAPTRTAPGRRWSGRWPGPAWRSTRPWWRHEPELTEQIAAVRSPRAAGRGDRADQPAGGDGTNADLVISASGTSTWELMCLGATAGLVCVVDNQVMGYERAVATGAAAGVGVLSELQADPATATGVLRELLAGDDERLRLARAGWRLVDGLGRRRVVDALLERVRPA